MAEGEGQRDRGTVRQSERGDGHHAAHYADRTAARQCTALVTRLRQRPQVMDGMMNSIMKNSL